METSTLRWILIIVGIVIVGSIFLFGKPDKKRKPRASRKDKMEMLQRQEPTLESAAAESEATEAEYEDQGELAIGGTEPVVGMAPTPRKPTGPPPDKINTLFLLAKDNHIITGAELLQAAVNTGMEFGDMNIFHRIPKFQNGPYSAWQMRPSPVSLNGTNGIPLKPAAWPCS